MKKNQIIFSENYKGSIIEIVLEKDENSKTYKTIINGTQTSNNSLIESEAINQARLLIEEERKKQERKIKRKFT